MTGQPERKPNVALAEAFVRLRPVPRRDIRGRIRVWFARRRVRRAYKRMRSARSM